LAVEVAEGDLLVGGSLARALSGCDTLLHVAARYTLWERDPRALYEANVEGTRRLMEAALSEGVRDVVYTSSVAVLAPPTPGEPPSTEASEPASLEAIVGDYKRSKYLAEKVVTKLCGERGLPARIVLPSTPIGPRDVKPTPTGKIVLDYLLGKMPAYLDTGLNLIAVTDCAAGHLLALEKGVVGERYILGNEDLSLKAILDMLADLTGLPPARVRIPYALAWTAGAVSTAWARLRGRPPGIPLDGVRMARKRMWFDPGKARRELDLPQTPVREALRRAALWFCENGYVPAPRAEPVAARLRACAGERPQVD